MLFFTPAVAEQNAVRHTHCYSLHLLLMNTMLYVTHTVILYICCCWTQCCTSHTHCYSLHLLLLNTVLSVTHTVILYICCCLTQCCTSHTHCYSLHLLLMNTMLYVTHTLLNMYRMLFGSNVNTNQWIEKIAYFTYHINLKCSAALSLARSVA